MVAAQVGHFVAAKVCVLDLGDERRAGIVHLSPTDVIRIGYLVATEYAEVVANLFVIIITNVWIDDVDTLRGIDEWYELRADTGYGNTVTEINVPDE